jgi:hypothetical protein
MRSDMELEKVLEQLARVHALPAEESARKTLELIGDVTGEEVERMLEICRKREAKRAPPAA